MRYIVRLVAEAIATTSVFVDIPNGTEDPEQAAEDAALAMAEGSDWLLEDVHTDTVELNEGFKEPVRALVPKETKDAPRG